MYFKISTCKSSIKWTQKYKIAIPLLGSTDNQINKDQTQITNIKSSKGKTTNNTQGNTHKDNS